MQCITAIAFAKNDFELLNCPCWVQLFYHYPLFDSYIKTNMYRHVTELITENPWWHFKLLSYLPLFKSIQYQLTNVVGFVLNRWWSWTSWRWICSNRKCPRWSAQTSATDHVSPFQMRILTALLEAVRAEAPRTVTRTPTRTLAETAVVAMAAATKTAALAVTNHPNCRPETMASMDLTFLK